ncbi:MAG TPA: hypothetical protein VKO85_06730 [Wenzhouxiangellaceae bacterium]|nr:hypothetical protein [Wenzhouxiangellaceae bacterium]
MTELKQLLIDLAKDPELQDQYEAAPKETMQRYKLSEEEIKAMLDKDIETVKRLSGLDELKSNGHIQAHDYK